MQGPIDLAYGDLCKKGGTTSNPKAVPPFVFTWQTQACGVAFLTQPLACYPPNGDQQLDLMIGALGTGYSNVSIKCSSVIPSASAL